MADRVGRTHRRRRTPRESDLLAEFGVSRPSLREALRVLETEGLIRIRRGNVGGAVVRRPTASSAAYHLSLTLRVNEVTHDDLAVARLMVEPICAALAAELPDRQAIVEDLTRLVDESERCDTTASFTESAHEFHRRLTELCGNTTMAVMAGTLEAVWAAQENVCRRVSTSLRPMRAARWTRSDGVPSPRIADSSPRSPMETPIEPVA